MRRNISACQLCKMLSLEFEGKDMAVQGLFLAGRETQYSQVLSFAESPLFLKSLLMDCPSVCAIIARKDSIREWRDKADRDIFWIYSEEPEKTFYDIHEYLLEKTDFYERFDFPAIVGKDCRIDPRAILEPGVHIGERVTIGAFTRICSGTVIDSDTTIGCGTTIGEDGFQVVQCRGVNRSVAHCGQVHIGKSVSIGSQCVVHKSLLEGATKIGDNSKLDALVYVGHNCTIGKNAVVMAGTILCGSCTLEDNVKVGVNSGIKNKVVIQENSFIGMGSVVTADVPKGVLAYGVPARERRKL